MGAVTAALLLLSAVPAAATPVCTDGYMGGPPLTLCGGRVFPEVTNSNDYVQYMPDPATGFSEYRHGLEYLEETYPRWISVFTLNEFFDTKDAVSAGADGVRSYEKDDADDGHDILVVKLTDHTLPDKGKEKLMFSLSIHGDEKGGIEGGVRTAEDLVVAAEDGDTTISDGIEGYESTTGRTPKFHEYPVRHLLQKEVVYLVDFNIDGWTSGDRFSDNRSTYTRGNSIGTDLNRQAPTVGYINPSRNPMEESEMLYGYRFMKKIARSGVGKSLAYGADVHGEGQSRAWVDIMYPAGQFDSIKHRKHMAIAERTKSVIDATLFEGSINEVEEGSGGDGGEGAEDYAAPPNTIPTKPARWGTVWDTLGYTDTGFLGDYLANELGVTGMDYEIAFNHSDARAYGRPWSYLFQENYVAATRAIIKTAMAYAMYQAKEFNEKNTRIDPKGRVGYVYNPVVVTHKDGVGTKPGPGKDGLGANGKPVKQRPYKATNMNFFKEENSLVQGGFNKALAADVAKPGYLNRFDTLVLADITAPKDAKGRKYKKKAYFANIKKWVENGGNLVLTDRALHLLATIGVVPKDAVTDINVYQPYANFVDFEHMMLQGLRPNARQLAEATLVGYGIGDEASPMSVVATTAWEEAGGHVVGTTGPTGLVSTGDDGSQTSVGELKLGKGQIRIMGGGLPMPTEINDHRYGLKDYALTYSGLYIMENSIVHDAPNLGPKAKASAKSAQRPADSMPLAVILFPFAGIAMGGALRRRRVTDLV
jgi:hypothetical protein